MKKLWLVLAMSFISSGAFAAVTCAGGCTAFPVYCYDAQGNESKLSVSGTSKSDGSGGCYCDTGGFLCPGAGGAAATSPRIKVRNMSAKKNIKVGL